MPPSRLSQLLAQAGVTLNGSAPCDPQIHDTHFYARVIAHGSLGLGEAYMDGWWDADDLDGFLYRLLSARLDEKRAQLRRLRGCGSSRSLSICSAARRAFVIGERTTISATTCSKPCSASDWSIPAATGKDAPDLDDAQEAKLDLVCRKLGLKSGHARARHRLRLGRGAEVRGRTLRRIAASALPYRRNRPNSRANLCAACRSKSACRIIATECG